MMPAPPLLFTRRIRMDKNIITITKGMIPERSMVITSEITEVGSLENSTPASTSLAVSAVESSVISV